MSGQNALAVTGLCKKYKGFSLQGVTFSVPRGTIVGLVGENGAGKSTTLRAVMGLTRPETGKIELLGREDAGFEVRSRVAMVCDSGNFPGRYTPRQIGRLMRSAYPQWDGGLYRSLLQKLGLPEGKKLRQFSRGMQMKLAIAAAFAQQAELLVLDEATSGLDPAVRDDILDMLLDFVQDAGRSVLVSSHITGDLEKVADYIVFLHRGRLVFEKPKDELRYRYGIIRCTGEQYPLLDREDILTARKQDYAWDVLVGDREAAERKYPQMVIDPASVEEVILLYMKGETA